MNCKQGDLAIVVRSSAGNEGKIVRCLRLIKSIIWVDVDGKGSRHPTWEIDVLLPDWSGIFTNYICDYQLRPIRDPGDDAVDETLIWLPVPVKEAA